RWSSSRSFPWNYGRGPRSVHCTRPARTVWGVGARALEGACDTACRMDPEEEAQLEAAAGPSGIFAGRGGKDLRVLAAGTAQHIVGLGVFVVGTFAPNVLISRAFGGGDLGAISLGIVTVGTQFAFIAAAGSRFGMDMAAVRYVAIEVGAGHRGRIRLVVSRSALIAGAISLGVGALTFALAGPIGRQLS